MSGSPVLVRDGAVDKVVGALSMGDIFATNGLALATPIQDMLSVERAGLSSMGAMEKRCACIKIIRVGKRRGRILPQRETASENEFCRRASEAL